MISCRLCGYQALRDTCALLQCPVCGEAYAGDDGQNGVVAESGLTQGGSASCGTTQQQSQFGAPVLAQCNNSQVFPLCYLNQELQSLLHLVPEQQRRKKRAQDAVRAAGALTPARADDDHGKPDAVYIRPRVDPTMRVLKGRYNTQPRITKAVSMSALHRLAHPLMGYDSMQALGPTVRRRRQESIERILQNAFAEENSQGYGRPGDRVNRSRSLTELSRSSATNARVRRRLFGGGSKSAAPRARLAMSADAVQLQRRFSTTSTNTPVGTLPRAWQRRHDERRLSGTCQRTRGSRPALQSFPLRESEGRRAKPNLRRKRVATMRSVNGWVREADPASTRRRVLLQRRMLALRRGGNRESRRTKKVDSHPDNSGSKRGSLGGGSTFLTALDTDGTAFAKAPDGGNSSGDDYSVTDITGKRHGSRKAEDMHPSRVNGTISTVGTKHSHQARRASGAGRRASPMETDGIARKSVTMPCKGSSRDGEAWRARNKSVGALDRQQRRLRGGVRNTPVDGKAIRQDRGLAKQHPTPLRTKTSNPENYRFKHVPTVVAKGVNGGVSGNPSDGWNVQSAPNTNKGVVTVSSRQDVSTAKAVPDTVSLRESPNVHTADARTAPAWDAPRSHPGTPPGAEMTIRRAWQENHSISTDVSCSAWQLVSRRGVQSATLQSFQDKVATPLGATVGQTRQSFDDGDDELQRQISRDARVYRQHSQRDLPRSESFLAKTHHRPASKVWTRRQSLPSLLTDHARPSSSKTTTPITRETGARRWREKRHPGQYERSGWMQRLDQSHVTVGDAWEGARGGKRLERGSKTPIEVETRTEPGATSLLDVPVRNKVKVGAVAHAGSRGVTGGDLLLNAVPKPLLYVGSGGWFRLRS